MTRPCRSVSPTSRLRSARGCCSASSAALPRYPVCKAVPGRRSASTATRGRVLAGFRRVVAAVATMPDVGGFQHGALKNVGGSSASDRREPGAATIGGPLYIDCTRLSVVRACLGGERACGAFDGGDAVSWSDRAVSASLRRAPGRSIFLPSEVCGGWPVPRIGHRRRRWYGFDFTVAARSTWNSTWRGLRADGVSVRSIEGMFHVEHAIPGCYLQPMIEVATKDRPFHVEPPAA